MTVTDQVGNQVVRTLYHGISIYLTSYRTAPHVFLLWLSTISPKGAPELRKKKGLPPPKELSKAKQASLSMSSAEDHHPSVSDRPRVVHIKASGFLENDAEHEYDASSSSSGSVDSVRVSMKGGKHEHATVVGAVGGSSRKHDHFSHPPPSDDFDQDHNYAGFGKKKKPRIVGAASSDEDSSTKRASALASPPISDSASLLYALATTCAKQVPSMESPPVSGQEDAPSEQRLVTPTTGRGLSSRRLWTDQHQHSGAAAASIGTSYTSYTSLTSSAALTASDSLRLEKEKTVQSFLITSLPCIYMDDVRDYTKRLVDDGFDCKQMLTEQLEEDDLDFMKKAHKRALLQVIRKEK